MAHLAASLPRRVELGAVLRDDWGTEVVTTDGGHEVRNSRWSTSLRAYDVSLPPMRRDDPDYEALRELFTEAKGKLHSFNFHDWTDETHATIVAVRFDTPLQITGIAQHLDHIDTFTLAEVRL